MSRIIVTIPDKLIKGLDQEAKKEQRSRSELVREFIRAGLQNRREEAAFRARQTEAFRTMDELRAKTVGSGFSGSEFIKQWRYRLAKEK